jgi:hypothetical protein
VIARSAAAGRGKQSEKFGGVFSPSMGVSWHRYQAGFLFDASLRFLSPPKERKKNNSSYHIEAKPISKGKKERNQGLHA